MNKENWPEFPFWWLEAQKRNMSGLLDIAGHLHTQTEGTRGRNSGLRGEANEIERQLMEQVSALSQQVYLLTDVTQALLWIIAEDHERRSTKAKRLILKIRDVWQRFWLAIEQNTAYRVITIIGTIVGAASVLWALIRYFYHFSR